MSEKHLAERLMYPLPDGWRDDPEQVAALKEIWPKIIAKNKELIDVEITSLRAQLDEARRKAIDDAAQVADEYALKVRSLMRGVPSVEEGTAQSIAKLIRALLSESKT